MDITWAMLLIAVGLVIGIVAFAKNMKKKSRQMTAFLGIAMLVIGVLPIMGLVPQLDGLNNLIQLGGETLAAGTTTTVQETPSGICAVEDTTVTLSALSGGIGSAAGGTHRYRICNSGGCTPGLTVSDAGTFTASPGDNLEILFGNDSSTTYYGELLNAKVPCSGTKTFFADVWRNGTLTIRVFNEEANLIDSASEFETLDSGDSVTLDMNVQGAKDYGFPHGGLIVAEWDKNNITDVEVNLGGSLVNVPTVHTVKNTTFSSKAYSVGPILSNQKIEGTVYIESKSGVNPDIQADIYLLFYPYDYYVNEEGGGVVSGPAVQDENNNQPLAHITEYVLGVD